MSEPHSEGMAHQADSLDVAKETFAHACMLWSWGEETWKKNGINGAYADTIEGFQGFVREFIESHLTCERTGGGSFRDHQKRRDGK